MHNASLGVGYAASAPTEKQQIGSPKYAIPSTRRGVVACHSSTGDAAACFSQADWKNHTARLAEFFHLIAADLTNPQNWGNDDSQDRAEDSWTHLQSKRGVPSSKCLLLALSMGALTALNWAHDNPTKVAAIALIIPVVNLKDAHDNRGFDTLIDSASAYGSHAAYLSAEPTHNPSATGRQAALAGIPIHIWYSTNDPVYTPTVISDFVTAVNAVGGNATATSMGAVLHTASGLNPDEILDFLLPYA